MDFRPIHIMEFVAPDMMRHPKPSPYRSSISFVVKHALDVHDMVRTSRVISYENLAMTGMTVLDGLDKRVNIIVHDKTFINKLLLGFWPQWQLHLYWLLLIGGILFVFTKDNKNPYCEWFCPFGAAQECLGIIGGAKVHPSNRIRMMGRWFQRILALGAIVLALIYRNPSVSSYEVFGAFFHLIGANYQFILLGLVLIAALFIRRPWCGYSWPY